MRLVSWVFGPMSIHPYNFESFCTSYISVIVIMPVNWQEKVRASTQTKAQLLTLLNFSSSEVDKNES